MLLLSWRCLTRSLLLSLLLLAGGAQAASILFVTTSPVPPGKFRLLDELAQQQGLSVQVQYAEKLPVEADGQIFNGHPLVVFDTPREHMREFVQTRLAKALPGLKTPSIWLTDAQSIARGIPTPLAERLHAYYINGGRNNFAGFMQSISAYLAGQDWQKSPAPILFPKAAIYHPDAPAVVFADLPAYLAWKKVDLQHRPPIIAIAFHQQTIAAEQTAFINDLIRRIERAGALALPFYSPVMDADAFTHMLVLKGKPVADVLINTQIMLNPDGRRKEFTDFGIPVIQAMAYRKGDVTAWQHDPQGVALMDVPFYLAQAEYAGVTDIQVAAAHDSVTDQLQPIPEQAATVVAKAMNLVALQRKPAAEKKVAIFFWNYPPGEKNLSASFMNLPRSLSGTLLALKQAGYQTETPETQELTSLLQRLLAPTYRPAGDNRELEALAREDLAALLPVARYRAWLNALPEAVQKDIASRWGAPEKSAMVIQRNGQDYFVIPRLKLGNLVILPQPGRGERWEDKEKALYHSSTAAPSHYYLATYLWVRSGFPADAIVHFGTHGTQEWLPGKERGLSMADYPMLAVGDVPVIYPYIVDNIGEATQAKRRGRATIISHQTPPFAPAGLHDALTQIHDLLHAWLAQDAGAVKEQQRTELLSRVRKEHIDQDLGWSNAQLEADFKGFVDLLHDHLHELARTAQPMGLHTFGQTAEEKYRMATVLMMLGKPYWEGVVGNNPPPREEADEMLVDDYTRLVDSKPYQVLKTYLSTGTLPNGINDAAREQLSKARAWYDALAAESEMSGLLNALAGQYIPTSYGGDPIKNPDALPTGRNLYGFDPSRVPTPAAWAAGKEALENLLAAHRKQRGETPKKLTFSLWSVETMRHQGMLEAQAFWALGTEPVWDQGGRVVDVKLIPAAELKRPRVDVVLSATGLYRDHFPNIMKWLAKAAKLAAEADEPNNPVAVNAKRIADSLRARGWSDAAALRAGQTRIFSSESGKYGTGLDDATLATDTWKGKAEGDRKLAQLYLSRMQFAYGPDEAEWGKAAGTGTGEVPLQSSTRSAAGKNEPLNLYAEHLKGTEGAVLARTSNLYGMLTTDDPFQYLGGISLAVRHLDGKAPELYISNLRGEGSGKVEGAAQFLAKELATRNFHPGYIKGLMQEGYAGTLEVLDSMNNFWGWTATAREVVRDDQWQSFVDVYVRDKHNLGMKTWFERNNPHALAQTIERMLEASRQGYWQADAKTVAELKTRYRELASKYQVSSDNKAFSDFVNAAGFGLSAASAAPLQKSKAATESAQAAQKSPQIAQPEAKATLQAEAQSAPEIKPQLMGMKLERVEAPAPVTLPPAAWVCALLLLVFGLGSWRVVRHPLYQ